MTDQQPWGDGQGRWPAQDSQAPQSPWAQQGQAQGQWTAALSGLLTPLTAAAATGALLLLTVLSYALSWKKATADDTDFFVNGFGIQKVTEDGESGRGLATALFFVALIVVLLLVAAVVIAALTKYPKFAALLVTVAGGLSVIYVLISFLSDFGMDRSVMGIEMESKEDYLDFGFRFGLFLALLVSLLTLALGVLYLFAATGRLLPAVTPAASTVRAPGIGALLRPVVVAPVSVVLLLVLVGTFFLDWRSVSEKEDGVWFSLSVDGLGQRTMDAYSGGERISIVDLNLLSLLVASAVILLIVVGILFIAVTGLKKVGGVVVSAGAALALLYSFIGLVTDLGAFREFGGENPNSGYLNSTDISVGVVFAFLVSLLILAVAVMYLLKEFGVLGVTPQPGQWAQQSVPWAPEQGGPQQGGPQQGQTSGAPGGPHYPEQPGRWS